MKIAVTAQGGSLQAQMDDRFGRCKYFIIYDSETNKFVAVSNPSQGAAGGAGPSAVREIARYNVSVLITGNVGINAQQALDAAKIKLVTGFTGTVKEVIDNYQSQKS